MTGLQLRSIRKAAGLQLAPVAKLIGFTTNTLSIYEGQYPNKRPSAKTKLKWQKALKTLALKRIASTQKAIRSLSNGQA